MEKTVAKLYLSRRNLEVLLSKLDRVKAGEQSHCSIIKYKHEDNPPEYQQTMTGCQVFAVEDEDFYTKRPAGTMLSVDEPPEERHTTGSRFGSFW